MRGWNAFIFQDTLLGQTDEVCRVNVLRIDAECLSSKPGDICPIFLIGRFFRLIQQAFQPSLRPVVKHT